MTLAQPESERIMNFIKKEFEAFKKNTDGMSKAQKFDHIYYYYKFHFVFVIIMVLMIGNLTHSIMTKKDANVYGIFINVTSNETERNYLIDLYAESFGVDLKKEEIVLDETIFYGSEAQSVLDIASQEKLAALMITGTADVIATEEETFYSLAYSNMFYDLRDCLSDAEIEMYEPYFCYIDKAVLDFIESSSIAAPFDEVVVEVYPSTIEEMENPIPVGLLIGNHTNLGRSYYFMGTGIIGIPLTTDRLENTKNFLSVALN